MEIKEITRKELIDEVQSKLKTMDEADLKWFYCYFHGFDDWPLVITDSIAPPKETGPEEEYEVSGHTWAGGEECPF